MPSEEAVHEVQETPKPNAPKKPQERERSTVVFPYLPLEDAIQVAKGVHAAGGSHCQLEQLAAKLNTVTDASGFNLRLNTARIFGLITRSVATVMLTQLGTRICDPQQEALARAESFLKVPLYLKIYEQFKGANLPPNSGLEAAIGSMGVATKQRSNARQVFQRAAAQAGFFAFGPNRLVYPTIKGALPPSAGIGEQQYPPSFESEKPTEKTGHGDNGSDGGGGEQHPFIQGLIRTLPKTNGPWPIEKRAQWLQAAVSVFNLIYADDGTMGTIEVKAIKGPGPA